MNELLFNNILTTTQNGFIISLFVTTLLGLVLAFAYKYKTFYSKQFLVALALLPVIVQVVIFLVNGKLGTGVAVMGAFSLIKFRSYPGGAKEILAIFIAMAIGLGTGVGYLGFSILFTLFMALILVIYEKVQLGKSDTNLRQLTITIPENLDYEEVFEKIFQETTLSREFVYIKTSDMGSLFRIKYLIRLKDKISEKTLIDKLRVRNGNLEINISRNITKENEL